MIYSKRPLMLIGALIITCPLETFSFTTANPSSLTALPRRTARHRQTPILQTRSTTALQSVSHSSVQSGLDNLYPPNQVSIRNAASRTDGYWKYIKEGVDPPVDLTYGEFDFSFFADLLEVAWGYYCNNDGPADTNNSSNGGNGGVGEGGAWSNKVFCDIGSGTGRLVIGAAALHPCWNVCHGLELLEGIHNVAVENLDRCLYDDESGTRMLQINEHPERTNNHSNNNLPLAPIQFRCGSFTDPTESLSDIDCAFVFSTCFSPNLMQELSHVIGTQLKVGSIVITTEYPLVLGGCFERVGQGHRGQASFMEEVEGQNQRQQTPPHQQQYLAGLSRSTIPTATSPTMKSRDNALETYNVGIELIDTIDGTCGLVGGTSTAYIHRVAKITSSSMLVISTGGQ